METSIATQIFASFFRWPLIQPYLTHSVAISHSLAIRWSFDAYDKTIRCPIHIPLLYPHSSYKINGT